MVSSSSSSPLDALKPHALVDFHSSRHTPFKHWANAARSLDDQASQAEHDHDWDHAWIWSRKAANIANYLASEHPDRSKPENKDTVQSLLRLVTSLSFRSRIKSAELILLSRSAASKPPPPPAAANGPLSSSLSAANMPSPPSPSISPPPKQLSIKERMAALRGAGLNTGGDEPVVGPGKRASVHGRPSATTTTVGESNGMSREDSTESRTSSDRGRKRDDVIDRLEKMALQVDKTSSSSPASVVPPPPAPLPAPAPSSTPLTPTQASPLPPSQPPLPPIEILSPSPNGVGPPTSTGPSLDTPHPGRTISHSHSASVPIVRSSSQEQPLKPKPSPLASVVELSNSAPPALDVEPLVNGAPLVDEFSPSRFGHFPSITEFESSTGFEPVIETEGSPTLPSFPTLPSVPLSLPGQQGSPVKSGRPLPNPPSPSFNLNGNLPKQPLDGKPVVQHTGSSIASFNSIHSASSSTSGSTSSRPLPVPASVPASKPDFPLSNTIFPSTLRQYLSLPVEILLLDVRPSQTWSERITPPSIGGGQVDNVGIPSSLLSLPEGQLSSRSLTDGLPRTSPFHNRNLYDLVIVYDNSSSSWSDASAEGVRKVNQAVYEREFGGKMLKRAPVLLVGGWEGWKASAEGMTTNANLRLSTTTGREVDRDSTTPAARPSYSPLIPPITAAQASRVPTSSSPAINGQGSFPSPLDIPARPSSSIPSAGAGYNHSAQVTSPPAQPASLAYPLTRRRSDYVDQSAYTGHPGSYGSTTSLGSLNGHGQGGGGGGGPAIRHGSIDYPILSPSSPSSLADQHQHAQGRPIPASQQHRKSSMSISHPPPSVQSTLPQPPPVAATPPLERHSSRGALVRSGSLSFPTLSEEGKLVQSGGNEVTYWGDEVVGLSGLKNLGNTCYQNSTLQCLSATEPFSTFFRDGRWKRSVNFNNNLGTKGNLASAYSSLISALWQQEYHFIQPLSFRKSIVKFAPTFDGVDQHDSQEFLAFLLDGLHEDLNRVLIRPDPIPMTPAREAELNTLPTQIAGEKEWQIYKKRNDSLVVDLFQGQYRSRMECQTCHQTSTTFDAFMYLSLPVPTSRLKHKVSLEHCLDTFVKEETMEKGNAWNCPKCRKARTATKSLTLSRLPPVLLIHLKRFSSKNGVFWDKAETLVEFPIKYLDLTRYMPPPLSTAKDPAAEAKYREDPRTQSPPYVYELYAVSNHSGSLTTGHYTAYVKSSQRHWKFCDDRTISEADEKDVMNKHAYILFYRRVPAKRSL